MDSGLAPAALADVAPVASPPVSPPTTASPFVTLQPAGPSGGIPGDANDGSDFFGLGAALLGIALIVVLAKLAFRGRTRTVRREDADRP